MNREQRRKYDRKVKTQKNASICPECNHLAMFYTTARGEKDTVLKCERCDAIVREGEELTKMIPPGIYCPLPLPALDQVLLEEAARVDKEKEDESDKDSPVEGEGSIT